MQILHIEYVVSANAEFFQDTTWVTWVGSQSMYQCSKGPNKLEVSKILKYFSIYSLILILNQPFCKVDHLGPYRPYPFQCSRPW